jgi:hypothetical protein
VKDEVCAIGYRRLPARTEKRWAPGAIARTAIALAFRKRSSKIALVLCAFVVFAHGATLVGQVLVGTLGNQLGDEDLGGRIMAGMVQQAVGQVHGTLSTFLGVQLHATALLLAVVAGGLIAEDRRTRAFELYFSRPLGALDYAIGKGLVAVAVPFTTIFVPFLGLWILAVGIAPDELARELWRLLLPGLLGALLCVAVLASTLLGASALGERGRTVGVAYVLGLGLLGAFADGLAQEGIAWAGYLGPLRDVQTVADALLRSGSPGMLASVLDVRAQTNDSALFSALALFAMIAGGLAALAARLRAQVRG